VVLTMADALAPDAPLVHPDWRDYEVLLEGGARGGNVAWEATVVRGDVDAAFARPDVDIIESAFRVGRQNHVAFEPREIAQSDNAMVKYHVWLDAQISLGDLTAQLTSESAGVKSVAWEQAKRERA